MKDISAEDIQNNLPLVCRPKVDRNIYIGNVHFDADTMLIMAGPCTIESKDQIFSIAKQVKESGAQCLRGGVFKPLTFPYGDPLAQSDRDSGGGSIDRKKVLAKTDLFNSAERRLKYFKEAGDKYDLPIVTEILYADSLEMMLPYVDMFQIGYRSMFNMDLIQALSQVKKPVMIKRHYGESLRSLLGVAEHFEARGKHDFVFCERGVAAPHTHTLQSRSILDVQAIVALKEIAPSVPVIADPSHSTFKRSFVQPMAQAAIAAGANGILIDVHPNPESAWVDPLQALDYVTLNKLISRLNQIRGIVTQA